MSLLYKRLGPPDANGKRKELSPFWYVTKTRESTRTSNRKHAEEYARKALTEHWRTEALGEATHTWDALVSDWLDTKDGLASYAQDRMVIERISELLQRREITALGDITSDVIDQYRKVVKAESSASTANKHMTTLRAMLWRAAEKNPPWIDRVPTIENYQVTKKEVKWLTIDQFNTILPHLPDWVADMAIMAVQTGMRYSNVAGLRWEWISADGSVVVVPAVQAKTKRTYTVPLSTKAKEVLHKRRGIHPVYVFVGKKRCTGGVYEDCAPVPTIRYWWESAREAAGFPTVRWHDLRHTWASLHVQNGTPDRILMQMGGWASARMLENYAHLATSHLTAYAENVK
jgi:integrase